MPNAMPRLGRKRPRDDGDRGREDHCRANALHRAPGDQQRAVRGDAAAQRGEGENCRPGQEQPFESDEIAELARRCREAGEDQQVDADHPVRGGEADAEIPPYRGKRDPDHGHVEHDQPEHAAHGHQDPPTPLLVRTCQRMPSATDPAAIACFDETADTPGLLRE
jgi:hypothetical protein